MTSGADTIHNFLFEGSNVRGIHVRLEESWQAVLSRNPYPIAAQSLLGEALAASTLLGATVKMDGTLTLQTRGDGPVKMLVVQVTGARTVRGMVSVRDDVDGEDRICQPAVSTVAGGVLLKSCQPKAAPKYWKAS